MSMIHCGRFWKERISQAETANRSVALHRFSGTLDWMAKQQNLFQNRTASLVKEFAKVKSEHDLRLKVRDAFFGDYSVDVEDERIDFLVYHESSSFFTETFMWAESKEKPTDVIEMFAQLLLTIKKKVDSGEMPPKYLGVFDKEKIAFTEYSNALPIFNLNDFNWNERPSSVTKETVNKVARALHNIVEFRFASDLTEIMGFIRKNFALGKVGTTKAQINKNNFVTIYNKWVREVLPTIDLSDTEWEDLKKNGIKDCDFYLADLLSEKNKTIWDKLNVVLQMTYYESKFQLPDKLKHSYDRFYFRDEGEAHAKFWVRYERPPAEEYRGHIVERRDLLVPQNIREIKGAYFTPQIWVEKSQEYLAKVFGENWQEEYYIWDCCAGTCNLLVGLTNKYNVWASTIDQPDVDIVHHFIANDEFNLLESHVFRFDFLNDGFDKLPQELQDIINDEEKRKKLIIYMNPPYAEAGSSLSKKSKTGVSNETMVHEQYFVSGEKFAKRELFVQFLMRIHKEMPGCKIAHFSKLKVVNAPYFKNFRKTFKAKLEKLFVVPADTFDNVSGRFPIGFHIWDTAKQRKLTVVKADVFSRSGNRDGKKSFFNYDGSKFLNDWLRHTWTLTNTGEWLGYMVCNSNDFQHQNEIALLTEKSNETSTFFKPITPDNLVNSAIYFAVRHCIEHTWLNDRDQFLYPSGGIIIKKFQNDCLIYTLFHHQNRTCSKNGKNHWIPFSAKEVDAKDNFKSTFMSDFLEGRKQMSKEAKAVFEAGKALWAYYHKTIKSAKRALVDASLYEIREYFKGRDEKGRMKTKATDEGFNELDAELRSSLRALAKKIQPKVYEYGFLRK